MKESLQPTHNQCLDHQHLPLLSAVPPFTILLIITDSPSFFTVAPWNIQQSDIISLEWRYKCVFQQVSVLCFTCLRAPDKRGFEDNSKIFFLISQHGWMDDMQFYVLFNIILVISGQLFLKNICCDPSLEPSPLDGSNDGSQNMFLWRNMANYP